MKTTNNAQKTENRKFGNSFNKTFAVAVSLVLISFTVSASGFWKQLLVNNTFGEMSGLMVSNETEGNVLLAYASKAPLAVSSEAISTTDAFFTETAIEKDMEIEGWMTDVTYFGSVLTDQISMEESFRIENWMIDNLNFSESEFKAESEPAMELEGWMLNEKIWVN